METEQGLATRYDASSVEPKWYGAWEKAGLFAPGPSRSGSTFTITIPPPNITGSLHMGHALCYPIQDCVGRFRRLLGDSVLILPGQDHAGIATQSVVDRLLRQEGLSASKIGRERFLERVWQWREQSGSAILRQFRALGCAFDWSRTRFTLDEAYVRAVLRVFVEWFDRGLIYRGKRVVNWDPGLETSVSDIEAERKTVRGKLYHVRYPFADGDGYITVATTRPETILGDVAVAVNEKDPRYASLVGRKLRLPLLGREIPLIADPFPDPDFGTGAVKVTPAHDPNDYEIGVRHGLDMPVILDSRARLTELGGPYAGLDRFAARERIVADLQEQGLLEKVEDHDVPLLVSERSGEPIEPLLSEQWFVSQSELAGPAIDAVESGRIRFIPERYARIYIEWMRNIRDWCVSRQLWWGHRIPVYYTESGRAVAATSEAEAERKAGERIARQDDDVLDTWFSSGLWPFATLGWPEQTEDLKRHYPTSLLVTDRNIINLWVARMIMMGLDIMGDIPFREVFIYATVLTEDGRRMSKSLGTGVDPTELIEKHGADALRFALLAQTGENQDIRFSVRRVEEARNFCNKIWNAARFVLLNVDEPPKRPAAPFSSVDRWVLSKLAHAERTVRAGYETYDLQAAAQSLHRFFWSEFCDWYIELAKSRLAEGDPCVKWVLVRSLESFCAMLHPIMPHLTEELYSHLPLADKSTFLMASTWPDWTVEHLADAAADEVERAIQATRALRALRHELGLSPMREVEAAYVVGEISGEMLDLVRTQSWVTDLRIGTPPESERCLMESAGGLDVYLPIAGAVDEQKERARIGKEIESANVELSRLRAQLESRDFVQRAKPEVVSRARERFAELEERIGKLAARLRLFGG